MSRRSLSFQPSLLQNWLKKDGEWIRLTSRFIAEMEPYLKEVHGNEIAECRLCKKTVIRVSASALISVRRHYPASEASYGIGSGEGENSPVSPLTPPRGFSLQG